MIFRRLLRNHLNETFGRFLSPEQMDGVAADLSEWSCFKVIVSRWRELDRYIDADTLAAAEQKSNQDAVILKTDN
jgi:hypothetical protein